MSPTEGASARQGQYIQANGLDIYYETHGHGLPLILLHGMPSSSRRWAESVPFLAPHFRLIIPDARGQGRTGNPGREIRLHTLADDVVALIEALQLDTPFLCGWSTGGDTVLDIAIRYPTAVRAMVVGGTVHRLPDNYGDLLAGLGVAGPGQVNTAKIAAAWPDFVAEAPAAHPQGPDYWKSLIRQISYEVSEPTTPDPDALRQVTTPALILWGDRDRLLPIAFAVELYGLLPHAELAVIPNADHSVWDTHTELLSNLVADFLLRH